MTPAPAAIGATLSPRSNVQTAWTAERVLFVGLMVVVALAPLPFASVQAWAWGLLAALTGVLLLGRVAGIVTGSAVPIEPLMTRPLLALYAMVVLWALFQTLSLSPIGWHHPLWAEAATRLGVPIDGSIALRPEGSMALLVRMCTYAGVFYLAAQYGRNRHRAKVPIAVIATAATMYAAYGLLEYVSKSETVLWFPKHAYLGDLTGTFINKNNFATYSGLGLLCTIALFYRAYSRWMDGVTVFSEKLHYTILFWGQHAWRYVGAMLLLMGALLYSHSRAGFTATLVGIVVFCLALAVNGAASRRFVRRFAMGCLVLTALLFAVSGRVMDVRLAAIDLSIEDRPKVYELTLSAIGDQPLLGSGLGSFEQVFRFYRTPDIHLIFDFAHNTYLESALELGLPAATLLLIAILLITYCNIRGARLRRRDEIYPCLGLGATALIGMHSLVDFSIQIPAVAVTYAAILGVAYAQSWSTAGQSSRMRRP